MKIECYNERNARSCNVRLTNLVETVNAAGINVSLPQGTIKLNISPLITHLKFMFHGVQWIVKVTNRVSLGNDLYNISYSIDWLKDYWLKYADNTGHYMIARTTVDSLIDPMLTDGERSFKSNATRSTIDGNLITVGEWYIAVVLQTLVYSGANANAVPTTLLMNYNTWYAFQVEVQKNTNLQNAMIRAFLVPFPIYAQATGTTTNTFDIYTGIRSETITLKVDDSPRNFLLVTKNVVKAVYNQLGFTTPAANWLDLRTKAHTIYIPGIGTVPVNPLIVGALSTVELWGNLTDGTVSATMNGLESTRTASAVFPVVPYVTSTAPQAIHNLTAQAAVGGAMAAVGAMTGGGLAAAGLLGIGVSVIGQLSMADYGAAATSTASGWDMVYNPRFKLTTSAPVPMLTEAEQQTAYGLPAGKPVEHLSDLTPGYYWLDCSNALIYGGTDYESAYRQALHNVRINVN